ncbi:MAG TPA: hypothetical protein VLE22_12140 [Bryobacteraceae bacterium]|nr:hypothetical protein [Bryobacteraceae bacterium]
MPNNYSSKRILIAAGLLALLSVADVCAETKLVRIEIPFRFIAGDQVLPAGVYRVAVDPAFNRMELRTEDGASGAFVSVYTAAKAPASDTGKLLFHGYGNTFFLQGVWAAGMTSGYKLPASKAEREMAKVRSAGAQVAWLPIPAR